MYLATLRLSTLLPSLGVIIGAPVDQAQDLYEDATARRLADYNLEFNRRVFGPRMFRGPSATLRGTRLLTSGGYLMISPDIHDDPDCPRRPVLGRMLPVAPGAARLSRMVAKPIVPFMLVPRGRRWRLWLGEPVEPTDKGLRLAVEQCLRHSPETYFAFFWDAWLASPPAPGAP